MCGKVWYCLEWQLISIEILILLLWCGSLLTPTMFGWLADGFMDVKLKTASDIIYKVRIASFS